MSHHDGGMGRGGGGGGAVWTATQKFEAPPPPRPKGRTLSTSLVGLQKQKAVRHLRHTHVGTHIDTHFCSLGTLRYCFHGETGY